MIRTCAYSAHEAMTHAETFQQNFRPRCIAPLPISLFPFLSPFFTWWWKELFLFFSCLNMSCSEGLQSTILGAMFFKISSPCSKLKLCWTDRYQPGNIICCCWMECRILDAILYGLLTEEFAQEIAWSFSDSNNNSRPFSRGHPCDLV